MRILNLIVLLQMLHFGAYAKHSDDNIKNIEELPSTGLFGQPEITLEHLDSSARNLLQEGTCDDVIELEGGSYKLVYGSAAMITTADYLDKAKKAFCKDISAVTGTLDTSKGTPAPEETRVGPGNRIIGPDDTVYINYNEPTIFHAQITAQVITDQRVCTGTLISENILLTSIACFENVRRNGSYFFNQTAFDTTVVYFQRMPDSFEETIPVAIQYEEIYFDLVNAGDGNFLSQEAAFLLLEGTPGAVYGFGEVVDFDSEDADELIGVAPLSLVAFSLFEEGACFEQACAQSPLIQGQGRCFIRAVDEELGLFAHNCDDEFGAEGASFLVPTLDSIAIIGINSDINSALINPDGLNTAILSSNFAERAADAVVVGQEFLES